MPIAPFTKNLGVKRIWRILVKPSQHLIGIKAQNALVGIDDVRENNS